MNKRGFEFVQEMNNKIKEYNSDRVKKGLDTFKKPSWSDRKVQERIMRIGNEARAFEIAVGDNKSLEEVAIATIINDFIKFK
jgi:hypothetical protein